MIDEVTLVIILKTPGSFPAPAVTAPPLHRKRRNPPSHQQPISQPAPGHHNATSSFIQPGRGRAGRGWIDSARSVTPPGEWTEQQIQIQPHQRNWPPATT